MNGCTRGQVSQANGPRLLTRRAFACGAAAVFGAARAAGAGHGRVVAVGDIHGEYERFFDVLTMAGLVDGKGNWTGGNAMLVQLGDVVDRGPASRRVLDLLMELEKQARRKGGAVEMLLGNHEVMRLKGDYRYTSKEEYSEFRSKDSEKLRDQIFEQMVKEKSAEGDPRTRPDLRMGYRQQWELEHPLGYGEMVLGFAEKGKYGKWLRKRPLTLAAGGTLFVHGGISPKYLMWNADRFAERMEIELKAHGADPDGFLYDPLGPFWYAGLALDDESSLADHVDAVLKMWKVQRIVVGHTPQRGPAVARFGGKVILADAGLSSDYGGPRVCVVIEGGAVSMILEGNRVQLK